MQAKALTVYLKFPVRFIVSIVLISKHNRVVYGRNELCLFVQTRPVQVLVTVIKHIYLVKGTP